MKKTFKLIDLDCANCAAKMEEAINRLDIVDKASVNFMSQRLTLEASDENFPKAIEQSQKAIKKIERSCKILV